MRIAVTGGSGFIGSHLIPRLSEDGHEVLALDVKPPARTECNFHQVDVTDPDEVQRAIPGCDAVVHLASSSGIRGGKEDVYRDVRGAAGSTHAVLEAVRSTNVRLFCLASSASVYGNYVSSGVQRAHEELPLRPISLFGAAKASAEALTHAYSHLFGVSSTIFRFGNVVGGRMPRGLLVDLVERLKPGPRRLQMLGTGTERKPFTSVADCAEAVAQLGLQPRPAVETFNVAARESLTVREAVEEACSALGTTGVDVQFEDTVGGWGGDIAHLELAIDKALAHGWAPRFDARAAVAAAARELAGKP